jgi:hypothetical protein
MPNEIVEIPVVDQEAPPEDYKEYLAWQANQTDAEAESPAAGEAEEPLSESSEAESAEDGQTAVESDLTDQQELENQEGEQDAEPKDRRLSRRIRKLTGTIASLETRLAALSESEAVEDGTEEVASSPETEAPPAAEATKRPLLRDFEDSEDASAWDQYEAAMDAFNQAQTQKAITDALTRQKQELDTAYAQQQAQAAWNKAASRYPNYNEIVARDEVKISAAMESIMRLDPEKGTSLAYYLGQHPEESERIAKATLANTEREWGTALARAGMELGALTAKLPALPGKEAIKNPAAAASAPKPQPDIKKVSTASKPPAQLRGQAVPKTDVTSEEDANDYRKWKSAREAQLRSRK